MHSCCEILGIQFIVITYLWIYNWYTWIQKICTEYSVSVMKGIYFLGFCRPDCLILLLQIFNGNKDTVTPSYTYLDPPIFADVIRIIPHSIHPRIICLRLEIHGCKDEYGKFLYLILLLNLKVIYFNASISKQYITIRNSIFQEAIYYIHHLPQT